MSYYYDDTMCCSELVLTFILSSVPDIKLIFLRAWSVLIYIPKSDEQLGLTVFDRRKRFYNRSYQLRNTR
jgi:hypothetical protein